MSKESERIEQLEKQVSELLEAKEKIDRQIEIKEEIDKFKREQEKGFFKYALDIFKLAVILAAIYTGGNKAIDHPFIEKLIK
jgi:hypothetical protein